MSDPIHNPAHYTRYPVQPIEISRHLGFCLGNAAKYVLRAPFKGGIEDCNKALKYLDWEAEIPSRDVPHWRFVLIRYVMDELYNHLWSKENTSSWDDGITQIQAEFLLCLQGYLDDAESSVNGMRDRVRDLVRAIAGKVKEEAQP